MKKSFMALLLTLCMLISLLPTNALAALTDSNTQPADAQQVAVSDADVQESGEPAASAAEEENSSADAILAEEAAAIAGALEGEVASEEAVKPQPALEGAQEEDGAAVQSTSARGTTKVYVYTKVTGDTSGLTLNGSGWYTLGYVEISGTYTHPSKPTLSTVTAAIGTSSFHHEHNTTIDISDVVFNSIAWGNGADDYVPAIGDPGGAYALHLDGSLTITRRYGTVSFRYVDKTTGREIATASAGVLYKADTVLTFGAANAKTISGYRYDSVDPATYTVVANANQVVTVYYVPDDAWTQDTQYTVRYTIEGVEQPADTITVRGTAWIYDNPALIAIADGGIPAPGDKYTGYKLDPNNPAYPTAGTEVNSGTVFTVNYVKDESQTQKTEYTVRYTIEGIEQPADGFTVSGTAWVNDSPAMIAIAEGGIPAPVNKYTGYKLDEANPEYPEAGTLVNSGSVYTVNYVKDDSQTQSTEYTVHYTIEGVEQTADVITVNGTAWVNDAPAMIAIAEGGIPAPADKYTGYKLDDANPEYPEAGTLVETGSTYTVNYVKDDSQTQPTEYTVHYTIEGVEQTADVITVTGTAWVNDAPAMIAIAEGGIPAPMDKYAGYKLDPGNPIYPTAGTQVESGSEYTVNYVKDDTQTQPTVYTIRYTVNGVEQSADTIMVKSSAWIHDNPAKITITKDGIPTPANKYKGFKLDPTNPVYPAAGVEVNSGSVFTVNYVKDDSQTKETQYTVRYTIEGAVQEADSLTVSGTAWVNDDPAMIAIAEGGIPAPADKYVGYKLDDTNPEYPEAGTLVESGSVYTVNYVKDDSQTQKTRYTVRYTVEGVEKDSFTVNGTAWVNDSPAKIAIAEGGIPAPADKYKGYKLDPTNPEYPAAGVEVNSGRVFTVNYVKDDSQTQDTQYKVRYTIEGVERTADGFTVSSTAWVNDDPAMIAIAEGGIPAPANKYTGYMLDPANPSYPSTGTQVNSGTVFTVNYVKDDSQTQPTEYTVRYTIEGVEQENDGFTVDGTAWVNDVPAKIAIAEGGIPAPADKYTGYKLDDANPEYPAAGTPVTSGSVFTVNYVKDDSQTQPTEYTVCYTIEGVEQTADVITVTSTAWVNDAPAKIAIAEGGIPAPADKYTGYKLDDANPEYPEAGTLVETGSTYTVNYVKDDSQTQPTEYTVHYTIEGVEQTADVITVNGTAWVNDAPAMIAIAEGGIPAPADKYTGYKLDPTNPVYPAAGVEVNSGSVFTVNYVKDDSQTQPTEYTVHYTIEGVEQTADVITVTGTAWVNDAPAMIAIAEGGIPAPMDKYTGYKLDPGNPIYPTAGTQVNSGSAYTVNYVKDDTQTQPTVYTIRYTINGVEQSADTVLVKSSAWIHDNPAKIIIAKDGIPTPPDKYTGYKLDPTNPVYPAAGVEVNSGSVFTVNYVKDDSQTKETQYTVRYTIEGAVQEADSLTVSGTAWVNDDPAMIAIAEGGIPAPAKKYTGYKLDPTNPAYPAAGVEVESGTVFTVNYVKDDSQTKPTQYTVRYTIEGIVQEADSLTASSTAWVNDDPAMIAIAEGGIPTPANKYTGYKLDPANPKYPAEGTPVESGSVFTVNYVKDDSQTQPTQYTVRYTVEGVERTADGFTVDGTAWVNDDPAMIAIAKGGIPAPVDKYTGYKLDPANPIYPTAGTQVNSGSVYTVNYVKDDAQTQPTQYTVRYTIEGVEQKNDGFTVDGTAWVNDAPAMIAIAEGGIPAPANKYTGYKLDPDNPTYPAAGTQVTSGSVYTVNYVKDDSQTQPTQYTVRYTIEGAEQKNDGFTVDGTAWVNDDPAKIAIAEGGIPTPADKYTGYKLDPANPIYPTAGTQVNSGSVYTVNYVKDDTQTQPTVYTIRYTIDGVEQSADTILVKSSAWIRDNPAKITIAKEGIPTPADKYTGYKLDPTNPEYPAAGVEVNSGSVFTVNYVKDDSQTQPTEYTVRYTIEGIEQTADGFTVSSTAWVNDDPAMIAIAEGGIPAPADKYTGYKLDEANPEYPAADTLVESGSVYTVNYVKDDSQTQPTEYTVRYTIEGVEQKNDGFTVSSTAWVNDNPAMIAIAEGGIPAPADKYTGYKLDDANPEYPAAGTQVNSGSVYTVNYVKDDSQTQATEYTVRYTIEGVEQTADGFTVSSTAWVNDAPAMIAIAEGGIPAPANKYTGYKLDSANPTYPAAGTLVETGSVYTVNYVKDDSQTQPTQYTVRYTIEGVEQKNDGFTVSSTAWVNDDPAMIAIAEGGIPAPADKYTGYKLDEANPEYPAADTLVESGSVYTVNYVKDDSQTQPTEYTVRYTIEGVEQTADGFTVSSTAWVNDDPAMIAIAEGGIPAPADKYTGYKPDAANPVYPAAGTAVETGSTYTVNYVKDDSQTKPTQYTVHYTIEGVEQPADTLTVPGTVWINAQEPLEIAIAEGGIPTPADKYRGYKLDAANPEYPAAGTLVETGSEYTVNYVIRTDLSYKVNYLEQRTERVLAKSKEVSGLTFGEKVTETAIAISGYHLVNLETQEIVIDVENNVITFYYGADGTQPTPVNPGPNNPSTPDPENPNPTQPEQPTEPGTEPVEDNDTPLAKPEETEDIFDNDTPLANGTGRGAAWALLNLILTVLTVLLSVILLIGCFGKKKLVKKDENGNKVYDANGNEVIEATRKKKIFWRVLSLLPAIGAVVAFILTENMRLPMIIVDRWTLLMLFIALVQVVVTIFSKKHDKENDDDDANKVSVA